MFSDTPQLKEQQRFDVIENGPLKSQKMQGKVFLKLQYEKLTKRCM